MSKDRVHEIATYIQNGNKARIYIASLRHVTSKISHQYKSHLYSIMNLISPKRERR